MKKLILILFTIAPIFLFAQLNGNRVYLKSPISGVANNAQAVVNALKAYVDGNVVWKIGGNTLGATGAIGTTGANIFNIITSNTIRGSFPVAGGFSVGNGTFNGTTVGVINASAGYRYNNAATSGQYLRGNGTEFVSSAIVEADLPNRPGTDIDIADAGSKWTGVNAETVLQEVATRTRYSDGVTLNVDPASTLTPVSKITYFIDSNSAGWTQLFSTASLLPGESFFIAFIGTDVNAMTLDLSTGSFIYPAVRGSFGAFATQDIIAEGVIELVYNGTNILIK